MNSLASGAQLRSDDPTSLKDIIDAIQAATEKRDKRTMSYVGKSFLILYGPRAFTQCSMLLFQISIQIHA